METVAKLMNVNQVAHFLGVSTRQVWNLRADGLLPQPVRLGRSSRWRGTELIAWVDAGCPSRDEWIADQSRLGKEVPDAPALAT